MLLVPELLPELTVFGSPDFEVAGLSRSSAKRRPFGLALVAFVLALVTAPVSPVAGVIESCARDDSRGDSRGGSRGTGSSAPSGLTFAIDPEGSSVRFELGAFLHTVKGSFDVVATEVVLEEGDQRVTGEIVLDARSADTGNQRRDRIMHGEILLSEEHPRVRLVPSRFEGELDPSTGGTIELTAAITLVGQTHEVVISLDVTKGQGQGDLRVQGEFDVPFVAWGLKDPSKPLLKVKKQVQIFVDLVLLAP